MQVFSLADTKFGKDVTQQLIGADLPSDVAQGHLAKTQFFGQQVQRGRLLALGVQPFGRGLKVLAGLLQGGDVPGARDKQAVLGAALPTRQLQQLLAQRIQACAVLGRNQQIWHAS